MGLKRIMLLWKWLIGRTNTLITNAPILVYLEVQWGLNSYKFQTFLVPKNTGPSDERSNNVLIESGETYSWMAMVKVYS